MYTRDRQRTLDSWNWSYRWLLLSGLSRREASAHSHWTICLISVWRDANLLTLSQKKSYWSTVLMTRPGEQEVATTLVTQACVRGGKINLTKTQGLYTLVKLLRAQGCRACRDIPNMKDKYPNFPSTKKSREGLVAYLDSDSSKSLTWVCYSGPFTKWLRKLLALRRAQSINKSKLLFRMLHCWGHMIQ